MKVRHKGSNTWSIFKKRGIFYGLIHSQFEKGRKRGEREYEKGKIYERMKSTWKMYVRKYVLVRYSYMRCNDVIATRSRVHVSNMSFK